MNGDMHPISLLLVEDNPGDVDLVREALAEGKMANEFHVARDGVEAMEFLDHCKQGSGPCPDLVLLDLNLPRKNGREVLAEIKSDLRLRSLPVVVLTSSREEQDIARTYELHANCYVSKPVDFEQFVKVVQSIEQFWFCMVKLPPHNRS